MASATERLGKVEGRLVFLEKEVKRLGEVVQEERQVALEQQVRMLKDLLEKQNLVARDLPLPMLASSLKLYRRIQTRDSSPRRARRGKSSYRGGTTFRWMTI